jgi:hypothetical protein
MTKVATLSLNLAFLVTPWPREQTAARSDCAVRTEVFGCFLGQRFVEGAGSGAGSDRALVGLDHSANLGSFSAAE